MQGNRGRQAVCSELLVYRSGSCVHCRVSADLTHSVPPCHLPPPLHSHAVALALALSLTVTAVRYPVGGYYKAHSDSHSPGANVQERDTERYLSFILYVNTDQWLPEHGGCLKM